MNARTPIPTGFPLWMLTAETALFRVESEVVSGPASTGIDRGPTTTVRSDRT